MPTAKKKEPDLPDLLDDGPITVEATVESEVQNQAEAIKPNRELTYAEMDQLRREVRAEVEAEYKADADGTGPVRHWQATVDWFDNETGNYFRQDEIYELPARWEPPAVASEDFAAKMVEVSVPLVTPVPSAGVNVHRITGDSPAAMQQPSKVRPDAVVESPHRQGRGSVKVVGAASN